MVKYLKAQINALMISMKHDYLTLMNITLFEEVIYKYLDPTSSQFVVIALVRAGMVYGNKFLWESLIFKKLWSISQEANWIKQKQSSEKRKLEQMKKPTSVQLDEKVEELLNKKMDSTLPNEVRSILTGSIKASSFKSRKSYARYSKKKVHKSEIGNVRGFFPHNKVKKIKTRRAVILKVLRTQLWELLLVRILLRR